MRILFDNGAPRGLARYLKGHTVDEARAHGWEELANGALIEACFCQLQLAHFDALIWPTLGVNSSPWGRLEPSPAAPGGRRV